MSLLVLADRHRGQNENLDAGSGGKVARGRAGRCRCLEEEWRRQLAPSNGRGCSPRRSSLETSRHGLLVRQASRAAAGTRRRGGGDQTTVFRTAPGMFLSWPHRRWVTASCVSDAPERQGHHRGYRRGLGLSLPPNCCHAKPATLPCISTKPDFASCEGGPRQSCIGARGRSRRGVLA